MSRGRGKRKLLNLCEKEDWTCYICGEKISKDYTEQSPLAPSRDHVVPKWKLKQQPRSQSFLTDNIKLAHRYCNNAKDNKHHYGMEKAERRFKNSVFFKKQALQ